MEKGKEFLNAPAPINPLTTAPAADAVVVRLLYAATPLKCSNT